MEKRKRSISSCVGLIGASLERVFEQLCPTREYDWIEDWSCELVHSESGFAELDCVFRTAVFADLGVETWTCSRYERPGRIEYTRMSTHTVIRLELTLAPAEGGTLLTARMIFSSLDAEGDAFVGRCDAGFCERHFGPAIFMLDHYLKTGKMISRARAMEKAAEKWASVR